MNYFSIEPSWDVVLRDEYRKPYFIELAHFVAEERKKYAVYPPKGSVFHALQKTPYSDVKVVIIGQDPYHGPGQAHGLSFSVPYNVRPPPSLQNVFKELQEDLGIPPPNHGCLEQWAERGVLLLNATLTVRNGEPTSHYNKGWEQFTDAVVRSLALRKQPVIFLLWGKNACNKCSHVPELHLNKQHAILTASHPSPYSVYSGFSGCKHFSKANAILEKNGMTPIDWKLDSVALK